MTKEELEKLKQTIDYFGHWYDVIGEERVSILEKSIKYIEELEKINSETLAQLNHSNGELIIENEKLRKENEELKEHIENIYANHCGNCNRNILNTRLKKELLESKLKLEALDDNVPWAEIKDKSEVIGKLTEATEIISELLHTLKCEGFDYTCILMNSHPVLIKAEQFLKDNRVKNG